MEVENEQNSTPETEGASLRETLAELWDKAERGESEPEEPEDQEPEEPEAEPEDEPEPETAEEEAEQEEVSALKAPEHWSASDRETFNTLASLGDAGVKAQQFLERRHKEMERAANEKFQEAASIRKRGEALDQALGEVKNEWAVRGIDEVTGIRSLITTYQQLGRDPVNTLRHLAQQLGVDPSVLAQSEDDPFADPALRQTQEELRQLKAQLAEQQAQQARSQQESQIQQIRAFEQETDERGQLKHPHFPAVWEEMGRLISAGIATDLPTAYAKAVAGRSDLMAQAQPPKAQAPVISAAERMAKAKKAQKAAVGLKSSAASNTQAIKPKSLREELSSLYDKQFS